MSRDVELRCRCGEVRGRVSGASRATVNRVVCYCDDCQAYAHHLGRADLLDAHGGTDLVQVAPASLTFPRGSDHIVGLRLSPKGLFRWYVRCCKTPVGNTLRPSVPFVALVSALFDHDGQTADDYFGPPIASILGRFAVGTPPPGSTDLDLRLIARSARLVLGWRLRGRNYPHPFFDRSTRAPSRPIEVLSPAEREALRPLCGPRV